MFGLCDFTTGFGFSKRNFDVESKKREHNNRNRKGKGETVLEKHEVTAPKALSFLCS